jgi:dolichol-phosphate mannosyltransferase
MIPVMLDAALERGVDVVYGVRDDRSTDTRLKRWTAEAFYRLMRRLAGPQVPHNAADFRLMSRRAMDAVNDLPEYGRVYRLAVPWLGFPSTEVTYARAARSAGETKYPMRAMLRLAFDSVTSFSAAPLRLATWLGGLGLLTCLLIGGYVLGALVLGTAVPGWASLTVVITFLGACQLLSMGLLGEYVGRLFEAGQRRPTFLVAYDSHAEETRRVAG